MGWPNWSRFVVYETAASKAPCAIPRACAAMSARLPFSSAEMYWNPLLDH